MSATNSEVSKKIRAAIKAKLEELGVYVDEELPDYIMVMIANKKEKTQMKDDLQLFLGKNSDKFVDWLFDIFDRLQTAGTATLGASATETSHSKKKESDAAKSAEKSRDEGDEKKRERKRRESDDRIKETAKEKEGERSKERNKERERKEKEKEREKYEAKVVKSKPPSSVHRRDTSPLSSHEKSNTHKRSEHSTSHVRKEGTSSKRDEERKLSSERAERREERKVAKEKTSEHKNEERQEKEKTTKSTSKKPKEKEKYESPLKKSAEPSAQRDMAKASRKRRNSRSKAPSPESDEKATVLAEPVVKQQPKGYAPHHRLENPGQPERPVVIPNVTGQPNKRKNKLEKKGREKCGKKNEERKEKEKTTKSTSKKPKEKEKYESPLKKSAEPSAQRDMAKASRKRRNSRSKAPSPESDEKATVLAEPVVKQQPKVSSLAVAKLPQTEQPKTVSSQIVVKRKLPDKENTRQQSSGVKSLFLKAIKEAGETTRIASQSAGYGAASSHKKETEPPKPATKDEDEVSVVEEEGIEIDDYGDLEDALVVMPATSSGGDAEPARSVLHESEECVESEQEVEESSPQKRRRILPCVNTQKEKTKFLITLRGQRIAAVASGLPKLKVSLEDVKKEPERPKKRRNEANPILAHLNLSDEYSNRKTQSAGDGERAQKRPRKEQISVVKEGVENNAAIAPDSAVLSEGSVDSRRTPVWDGQIQLEEDDDSSDDEAQIDAVLASAQTISVGFDEVPPTPTLTKPAFFMAQNQPQPSTRSGMSSLSASLASVSGEKLMERCKFWPNCRLEENCVYIHPSKPCSNFPSCHFGDRCLYVHPLCKFDRTCANPRCPYTHSPKPAGAGTAVVTTTTAVANVTKPAVVTTAPLSSTIPCKFGGRCANPNCTYKHPKLCRFGERCTNRGCYFWHPKLNVPTVTVAKYKWKAPTSI
ncbi:Zinc finger CCCH domain-containing protein 14 [Toxocara canis]|uniref:Zinc finger CCCH domain-containing protein 14 n=1 Tax=Toxocara canis TaxID=6265 RepID=A0A0B2VLC9_TOXCA|nr:Zinc finger CCCH domain-containing protein 14 [Toxocara canis]